MKVRVKPKYECGSAVTYISRQQAMKKLQLSMRDFRRLCILKGIYPHVPHNKKKANKGTSDNKVFYYRKDINFLAHEPIIGKFREYKVFLKKYNKLKAKNEEGRIKVLHDNKPTYSLDHIVKERYPTFASALRDLDDALSLVFVFSTLPYTKILKLDIINDCRRLSAEFMHYVIEAQALRNVFISIKGIYYQAEICGEKITWLVPHERGNPHVTDVDFAVLTTFSEFYVAMLGFVNYRLFATQGLHYPPKIETGSNVVEADDEEVVEKIYSLSKPIARKSEQPTEQDDDVQVDIFGEEDNALAEKIKQIKAIKSLFKGCVFYLNRETPREALTLIIRSCGGTVGWEGSGHNITETDSEITHHVVDRPLKNVNINRRYLQPQWVFDCLNARRILPIDKYLPGVTLPPHFSPFISEKPGDYIPVERLEELRNLGKDVEALVANEPIVPSTDKKPKKKPEAVPEKTGMRAELGRMHKKNKQLELNQQGSDNKMKEMMLARKHQRVYHSMKTKLKKDKNEALKLKSKRAKIEKEKATARV